MRYSCTLSVPLKIIQGASVKFSPVIEVSLACHRCCRANRTIVLSDSAAAEHLGKSVGYDGHAFEGKIVDFRSEAVPCDEANLITTRYQFQFEFEPFVDAKYPKQIVAPQPTWGRIHLMVTCTCGRSKETYTQTNLVRPRRVRCECGQILFIEQEQVVLFSEAVPEHEH